MTIYLGADHGGFRVKKELISYIKELGYDIADIGSKELNQTDNYPDIALELDKLTQQVSDLEKFRAILICGSGIGMCIAANKIPGVRAATCLNPETAYFARLHNNINVLCLAGLKSNTESIERVTDGDYQNLIDAGMVTANLNESKRIVKVFLETDTEATEGSRHKKRLDTILDYEKTNSRSNYP